MLAQLQVGGVPTDRMLHSAQEAWIRREAKSCRRLRRHGVRVGVAADSAEGRWVMATVYRRYCQTAAVIFVLITIYTVLTKLAQGRLADDWLHSVLHLCAALVGTYAGWFAASPAPAQGFTSVVGVLYFALGCYGLLRPGLLLATPFAIPLGAAENVFHFTLSLPALAILLLHRGRWPGRTSRTDRRHASS
jgi:hypothetical protein